jgi:CheY-like chemotaxis protein
VRQSRLFDEIVRLQVRRTEHGARQTLVPDRPTPQSVPVRTARVLVVEDSPMNQQVALGLLEQLGYRGNAVANRLEAIEAVRQVSYDAILMDCQMPEMDGFEASREIRRRESASEHVPIIAMTANAMKGDRERCLEAGMDDYLSKPVRKDDLEAALRRWIHPRELPARNVASDRRTTEPALETLDESALRAPIGDQPPATSDLLASLIEQFRMSAAAQGSALRAALERKDSGGLASAAHRLKGDAAILGAIDVRDCSAELENLGREAKEHWPREAELLLERLDDALHRALTALEQLTSTRAVAD